MGLCCRFASIALLALALVFLAACGGDDDDDAGLSPTDGTPPARFTPGLATAVTTAGAGQTAMLDGETFVSDRTLPPETLSAERLENAGSATTAGGETFVMARAASDEVAEWELVSAADAGWLVWQPAVVLDVLRDAGAGASLVSVEAVDWPDACLGAANPDEVCAAVITPGYRIVVEQGGETIEYHASRAGQFRRVTDG